MTPLHWAAFHNHSKHIQLLLDAAANPLPLDMEGKTPLHWTSNNKTASAAKVCFISLCDYIFELQSWSCGLNLIICTYLTARTLDSVMNEAVSPVA